MRAQLVGAFPPWNPSRALQEAFKLLVGSILPRLGEGASRVTLESFAKEYLSQGVSVIPVKGKHGRDIDDAKRPLIPWEEFQNRRATSEEISQWFTKWPQADLAAVTGVSALPRR